MKFEHWHLTEGYASEGDTRLPILDWNWFYDDCHYEYRWAGVRKNGFTGRYWKIFSFSLIVFRHEFGFRVEFGYKETTPELAFRGYHDRIKERNKE